MRRVFIYFAAFTGMGTLFLLSMVAAALVLGSPTSDDPDASAPTAQGPIGEITITAFDLGFEPEMAHVAEAGIYTVTFVNDGGTFHDVTFADGTVIGAEGHESATGEVTIPAGGMTFICSVPGHADAGMTGEVMVATAGGSGGAEPSPSASARTPEEMRDIDAAVIEAFPAETEGRGNQVLEPEVQADGTLQWELTASVIEWETEPGTVVEAYAYNGMVPGPQLRAEVGDRIRIILRNELPEPTTIHSHGFRAAGNGRVPVISQPAVMPGESFTYEYTLRNAGSHMYHSHFMAEHQVPMGLLGAFVVTDPAAGDPAVDQDIRWSSTTVRSASRSTARASRRPNRSSPRRATRSGSAT